MNVEVKFLVDWHGSSIPLREEIKTLVRARFPMAMLDQHDDLDITLKFEGWPLSASASKRVEAVAKFWVKS